MKLYVIKYFISKGIEEIEGETTTNSFGKKGLWYNSWNFLKVGKDVFLTKEEAIQAANKLKDKKIASLKKQIEKLEKLKF